MNKQQMFREDLIYEQLYENIPNTLMERIKLILGKKIKNEKFNNDIEKNGNKIKRLKKRTIEFTWYTILKPAARPRLGYRHRVYVPRAAENGMRFEQFFNENNLPKIDTPCKFHLKVYQKTPSNFSIMKKVLAELELIKPCNNSGDFDNYAKAAADAIQHGMLENDCLITDSTIAKRYSIKPRVEVKIEYYEKFPDLWR